MPGYHPVPITRPQVSVFQYHGKVPDLIHLFEMVASYNSLTYQSETHGGSQVLYTNTKSSPSLHSLIKSKCQSYLYQSTSPHCDKITQENGLQGEKIIFGSLIRGFSLLSLGSIVLGPVVRQGITV